jgi:hypothetical protein
MFEIFLRVPADDPKTLVRAAAVCTTWRRILCDVIFTRQYRAFHGAPPMLGFLRNTILTGSWGRGRNRQSGEYVVSSFVSTASFRSPACHDRRHWSVLDSRHGLVLFDTDEAFVVCDLVTYDRWRIKTSRECSDMMQPDQDGEDWHITWNATVLCAKDQCDHTFCHYGPFLLALVGSNSERGVTFASVYSSETRSWSEMISIEEPNAIETTRGTAVVGDKVYFQCNHSQSILEYNIGEQELSVFVLPIDEEDDDLPDIDLLGAEDGMLLFGTVVRPILYLWSMEAGPNGAEGWARHWIVELEPLLPPRALLSMSVAGFAEGLGVIFLSTMAGLYTIDISSGESKNVQRERIVGRVIPYMSFYTRGTN